MTSSVVALIVAITGLITALGITIPTLVKVFRVGSAVQGVEQSVQGVHTIVNQQRTDAKAYETRLVGALHTAGVDVPPDASLPVPLDEKNAE